MVTRCHAGLSFSASKKKKSNLVPQPKSAEFDTVNLAVG